MNTLKIKEMIDELNSYKRDRKELRAKYINERLNKSLQTYYREIHNAYLHELSNNKILKEKDRW